MLFEGREFDGLTLKECFVKGYGEETFRLSRSYSNALVGLARWKNHVVFNLRCKNADVIPRSLRVACPIKTERGRAIANNAGRAFVRERLRLAEKRKKELEDVRKWTEIGFRRRIGDVRMGKFQKLTEKKAEKTFVGTRGKQCRKLDVLLNGSKLANSERDDHPKNKWVVNQSNHVLTTEEKSVLEKGLKFAPTPRQIPKFDMIACIEPALRDYLDQTVAEVARAKISGVLRGARRPERNITLAEEAALKGLMENENIVVAAADKGNVTVVLNTEDYDKKAYELIKAAPFIQIKKDPAKTVEDSVNTCVRKFFTDGKIKKPTYDFCEHHHVRSHVFLEG